LAFLKSVAPTTTTTTIGVGARGLGSLQPPDSGKTVIFRAKAKFFGQKPAAKNDFFYLNNEKTGTHSVAR